MSCGVNALNLVQEDEYQFKIKVAAKHSQEFGKGGHVWFIIQRPLAHERTPLK
jgi:hypothetical protein